MNKRVILVDYQDFLHNNDGYKTIGISLGEKFYYWSYHFDRYGKFSKEPKIHWSWMGRGTVEEKWLLLQIPWFSVGLGAGF
jgi:hypothetical protein